MLAMVATAHDIIASNCMQTCRVVIGIATRGRPHILASTLAAIASQTVTPYLTVVCYAETNDVLKLASSYPHVVFLRCPVGLTKQRNCILATARESDIVIFFDDDFLPHTGYIEAMVHTFAQHTDVVAATGAVLEDGIDGPGLTLESAQEQLRLWSGNSNPTRLRSVFNVYGCNMAIRTNIFVEQNIRFDELLPMYGWYEDVAFSRELAPFGKIVSTSHAAGVHLGTKQGRQSGVRLGYSQIANPLYLARKGLVSWIYALSSMCSRTAKNMFRFAHPEPWVDRRGRLHGNILGWFDAIRGISQPSRINDL